MRKILFYILRVVLIITCVYYLVWKVDFAHIGIAFSNFRLSHVLLVQFYVLLALVPSALRMNFLTKYNAGLFNSIKTIYLGLGINNLTPVKLGEVAKAVYLSKQASISLSMGLNIVFWERFSDVNILLLLIGINLTFFSNRTVIGLALFCIVASIWGSLFINKLWPDLVEKILSIIRFRRLNLFITEFLKHLKERFNARYVCKLCMYSIVVWVFLISIPYLVLCNVAGFDLSFEQVLTVVIFSSFGMAIPSLPGAIGVYEAVVIVPLMWFGIPKEQALAAAILLHMIQYIPTTLAAIFIMIRTGLRIKAFKLNSIEV